MCDSFDVSLKPWKEVYLTPRRLTKLSLDIEPVHGCRILLRVLRDDESPGRTRRQLKEPEALMQTERCSIVALPQNLDLIDPKQIRG